MGPDNLAVVTGAFGYSGRYIAERLLAGGLPVRTLTGSPNRRAAQAHRVGPRPPRHARPGVR